MNRMMDMLHARNDTNWQMSLGGLFDQREPD